MNKEFMLYIRNLGDTKASLSPQEHLVFIKKCEIYIGKLKAADALIAAQPIVREGFVIAKTSTGWTSIAIDPSKELQVGYYHIKANDINEAIAIAKENPEFEFVPTATIEVRPIKTKEIETNFMYPSGDIK